MPQQHTHYFATTDAFISARWHQAFVKAHTVNDLSKLVDKPPGCVWLMTNRPDWQNELTTLCQTHKVIALTMNPNLAELTDCLELGAKGYTEALSSIAILHDVADAVCAGALWIPGNLVSQFVGAAAKNLNPGSQHEAFNESALEELTKREMEVVKCVVKGASNKEVAKELDISERTVKEHLSHVYQKLAVKDRVQLLLKVTS